TGHAARPRRSPRNCQHALWGPFGAEWWLRDREAAPDGLDDRTRASHRIAHCLPPELERALRSIHLRLQAYATSATRSCRIGATAIRTASKAPVVRPLPGARPIDRILPLRTHRVVPD